MVNYWKSKLLPRIKKVFDKNGNKKAAAEACKAFDDSKETINTEFEEKKTELQPKIVEVYEASATEIKAIVKDPKEADVKKNSKTVHLFLQELVKIDFPGAKPVCDASEKFGAGLVPGPVIFILEKVSTFVVVKEDKEVEITETTPEAAVAEEETIGKGKEIAVESQGETTGEPEAEPKGEAEAEAKEKEEIKTEAPVVAEKTPEAAAPEAAKP